MYQIKVAACAIRGADGVQVVPVMQPLLNARYMSHAEAWDEAQRLSVNNPRIQFQVVPVGRDNEYSMVWPKGDPMDEVAP